MFPRKKYQIIYADPPWLFRVRSEKGNKRSATNHYDVMSVQDIKDEQKNIEGDPKFKGYRMKRQREIAMNTIQKAIPQADVVVTNPTHFAVALKYDVGSPGAPKVLSMGRGMIAKKIVDKANENKITIFSYFFHIFNMIY